MNGARLPGLTVATLVAVAAVYLRQLPFAPFTIDGRDPIESMLIAIVLGALLRNLLRLPSAMGPGVQYAVHSVLPMAIVLLGARLDFALLLGVSAQALIINVVCVSAAMIGTVWLALRIGVDRRLGVLVGVGTAICGGTAIAVAAPLVDANEQQTAFAVTTINLFGLAWIFVFPAVGTLLALPEAQFGVWSGTAIHATAQVLAAGFSYGERAGEVALIVKLVRILLLAPCVVAIGLWYARERRRWPEPYVRRRPALTTLVPPFIVGFVLLAVARSLHLFPHFTLQLSDSVLWQEQTLSFSTDRLAAVVAGFLITVAMAGVGLGVNVRGLVAVGRRAFGAGLFAACLLALLSLGLVALLV